MIVKSHFLKLTFITPTCKLSAPEQAVTEALGKLFGSGVDRFAGKAPRAAATASTAPKIHPPLRLS